METETIDGAAVRLPPPIPYLAAVFAGWVLNTFLLTAAPFASRALLRITGATIFILLGLVCTGVRRSALHADRPRPDSRGSQQRKSYRPGSIVSPATRCTSAWPLIQIGLAFAMANLWVVALLPLVLAVVYATAIVHEETYLEQKFGDAYTDYKRSVRRWI